MVTLPNAPAIASVTNTDERALQVLSVSDFPLRLLRLSVGKGSTASHILICTSFIPLKQLSPPYTKFAIVVVSSLFKTSFQGNYHILPADVPSRCCYCARCVLCHNMRKYFDNLNLKDRHELLGQLVLCCISF